LNLFTFFNVEIGQSQYFIYLFVSEAYSTSQGLENRRIAKLLLGNTQRQYWTWKNTETLCQHYFIQSFSYRSIPHWKKKENCNGHQTIEVCGKKS